MYSTSFLSLKFLKIRFNAKSNNNVDTDRAEGWHGKLRVNVYLHSILCRQHIYIFDYRVMRIKMKYPYHVLFAHDSFLNETNKE